MSVDGNTKVLPEEKMRGLGFTDHVDTRWYYVTRVGAGITLNVTIDKSSGDYQEYVLDESFGQPYYYEGYAKSGLPFAAGVRDRVDEEVAGLRSAGLDVSVAHSAYDLSKS